MPSKETSTSRDPELQRNAILAQLPHHELETLRPQIEVLEAELRQLVYQPGQPIRQVFFPLSSIFSLVAVADGRVVEVATIGREGMVGLPVFLGAASSPHSAFCQIPGSAARLPADALRDAVGHQTALRHLLSRLTQATMVQVAQNVVCNTTHSAEQRAARWLLMTHDRVGRDRFALTQEFLAQMLGVRRPTVSDIARRLQSKGLIQYSRGTLAIIERKGLERLACECYLTVRREFDQLTRGAD